jgi:hypothetical protein
MMKAVIGYKLSGAARAKKFYEGFSFNIPDKGWG